MLHECIQRFDVTENLKILAKFLTSKRCHSKSKEGDWMGTRDLCAGQRECILIYSKLTYSVCPKILRAYRIQILS
jgi:hypothetical protein